MKNDDYLWSGEGEADPDVAELEALLRPLAYGGAESEPAQPRPPALRRAPVRWGLALAAAAAAVLAAGLLGGGGESVLLYDGRDALPIGSMFVAEEGRANELRLGDLGRLRLSDGSRLWIDQLDRDEVVLRLEEGELSAFVREDVRPGLFNVDTPATRCVDLGCAYDLKVDDDGGTFVEVTFGRVAFRNGKDEAFVPAGAVCRAAPGEGAGTPHFPRSDGLLLRALEGYDGADDGSEERFVFASEVAKRATSRVDALPVWHFLQDVDPRVRTTGLHTLDRLVGAPAGIAPEDASAEARAAWREHLWPDPFR